MTIDATDRRAGISYGRTAGAVLFAVLCVLLLQPLFALSLFWARSHTDLAPIRAHIVQGFDEGVLDVSEKPPLFLHSRGHVFTECTALLLALDDEPDALKGALLPQLQSRYSAPCAELLGIAKGIASSDRTNYARYWHGYRLYIWPMLEHFSVAGMRYISAALIFGALIVFALGLRRALGTTAASIYVVVLFSLTDIWSIATVSPHFISMAIILAGTGLFAFHYARHRSNAAAIVLAALAGAVFNFFDFLINPPMMPMLFAFVIVAVETAKAEHITRRFSRDTLAAALLTAMSWFGGYALTWMSKWALAIALSERAHTMKWDIIDQILLRTYGQEPDRTLWMIPLYPTVKMIGQAFISVGSVTVVILAAALFVYLRANWAKFERARFTLLVAPCVIPLLWFELLANHTRTHSHFTYRSESAAIAMFMAAAVLAGTPPTTLRALLSGLWSSLKDLRSRYAQPAGA